MKRSIAVSKLKTILSYDETSGKLYWLVDRSTKTRKGDLSGYVHSSGYVHVHIGDRIYKAHRLAWALKTGRYPRHDVEHRDLNKSNNRWANLRKGNDFKNQANTPKRADNTVGFKSVTFRKDTQKFRARLQVRGRRVALGSFVTAEEAHAAYVAAAKKYFGEFARVA